MYDLRLPHMTIIGHKQRTELRECMQQGPLRGNYRPLNIRDTVIAPATSISPIRRIISISGPITEPIRPLDINFLRELGVTDSHALFSTHAEIYSDSVRSGVQHSERCIQHTNVG